MIRACLILSLLLNVIITYFYLDLYNDHDRLVTWACMHASLGGVECGEL